MPFLKQELVAYQKKPFLVKFLFFTGDYRCNNCLFFNKPDKCLIVQGLINESDWCILWGGLPKISFIDIT